jgi:hypothetical protein
MKHQLALGEDGSNCPRKEHVKMKAARHSSQSIGIILKRAKPKKQKLNASRYEREKKTPQIIARQDPFVNKYDICLN